VIVDIPISPWPGLINPADLAPAEMLAFEIATASRGPLMGPWHDGGRYELLGVEFFESAPGTAQLAGATLFTASGDVNCGETQ
jgi:hypothetical protein